jgi:L-asparagine transporter-like permease
MNRAAGVQQGRAEVAGGKKELNLPAFIAMGLGGAIGFVVSGTPIRLAGPAILPVLLLGGLATTFITMMLAEMAVAQPAEGSWSVYADRYLGGWAGFLAGWMYWTSGVLTMATEVVASALLVRWWLPAAPVWLFGLLFTLLVAGLNLLDVRSFGYLESWLAFIKVGILVLFIVMGGLAIVRIIPGISLSGGMAPTGWFPGGWRGAVAALILVMYSYAGVQIIGPSTGDLDNPEINAPRALPFIDGTLLVLYVASIAVLINLVRWPAVSVTGSPFVAIFANLNAHLIGDILNLIILSAVVSAINSNMYGIPRMMMSLSERHDAPQFLARTDRRGVPVPAILGSAVCLLLVVVLSYFFPDDIFIYAASAGGVSAMLGWLIIGITHLAFRQKERNNLKLHYHGFPFTTLFAIVIILLALAGAFFTSQQFIGMLAGFILLLLYLGVYSLVNSLKKFTHA